jgi:3-oxoacyl-[acyl-carrier protein] reductase
MDLFLKNKVVLITGSSKGIGRAIGLEFARERARVVITGRQEKDVANTISEIQKFNGQGYGFVGDLNDENEIKRCMEKVINRWHGIDILISNLGSGKGKCGWNIEVEEWNRLLEINLMSGVKAVRFSLPYLSKSSNGCIIFISSIAGLETLGAPLAYEAAKAAVNSYSKHLSRTLGESGIRVNTVAPGNIIIPNGTWDEKLKADKKSVESMIEKEVPLKRFGLAEEIANAVLFLASSKAAFITGACLVVDGGQTRNIS